MIATALILVVYFSHITSTCSCGYCVVMYLFSQVEQANHHPAYPEEVKAGMEVFFQYAVCPRMGKVVVGKEQACRRHYEEDNLRQPGIYARHKPVQQPLHTQQQHKRGENSKCRFGRVFIKLYCGYIRLMPTLPIHDTFDIRKPATTDSMARAIMNEVVRFIMLARLL